MFVVVFYKLVCMIETPIQVQPSPLKKNGSSSNFHIGIDQGSFAYDKLAFTNLDIPHSNG